MNYEFVIAVFSVCLALFGTLLSFYNQSRLSKLNFSLEQKKKELDKKEEFEKILSKYKNILLKSSCDLQSRFYNIARLNFLEFYYNNSDERDKEYCITNTLFITAEFLGWIEIIRKEIQFLDLGEDELTKKFNNLLEKIILGFSESCHYSTFKLYRGEQRAIGEIMIKNSEKGSICIGYAEFKDKLKDGNFNEWFITLRTSIKKIASEKNKEDFKRVILLQNLLIDLIDFLDPSKIIISETIRKKVNFNELKL